jgi:hypothetical protein
MEGKVRGRVKSPQARSNLRARTVVSPYLHQHLDNSYNPHGLGVTSSSKTLHEAIREQGQTGLRYWEQKGWVSSSSGSASGFPVVGISHVSPSR